MKRFEKICILLSAICVLSLSGCGSETTAGVAGVAGGFAASNTLKGMQADLERREQALIARYNELVEAGEKAETLEELKEEIQNTVLLRQSGDVAKQALGTDWNDPAAAGGAVGTILALIYAYTKRKELNNTVAGIKAFRSGADEGTKQQLDKTMLDKRAAT